ncbi:hypothetical protein J6TS1_50150 [Siminovitchia terrae]|uniref:DUF2273 domain-containing protein n=1 Tax=Siminovitchia terrae TaxID=1914933 RepID=A0ABQ4L4F5_SIMTE|nr:hypothetical protein [Siminovitchia terrae]GIN99145.1 hypothetical protein J6TS1_50150 [Siminovitchia terrae]
MKRYLKKRYKTYLRVAFGLLIGFIVVTFLFDKQDYKSAIFAVLFGLIVGELFVFSKGSKDQKKEKNY